MGLSPDRANLEATAALALGHAFVAVAGRLRHQHVLMLLRLVLDHRLGGRAADFFLRHEDEGNGQRRLVALADDVVQGVKGDISAGLHVIDAGPVDHVALAADLQRSVLGAVRVHRVHVREHDFPLRQLRDVVANRLVVFGPGVNLAAVAAHVHRQRIERVHPLAGQVVERADDALSLSALPDRIARPPVLNVRFVAVQAVD